jgi:hypothetical protein
MGEGSNPVGAFLGFWMLMQLVSVLLTLIGGLYALWCLNRLASSSEQNLVTLERLAAATERMAQTNGAAGNYPPAVSQNAPAAPIFPAPQMPAPQAPVPPQFPPPIEPVPFTPGSSASAEQASPPAPVSPPAPPENRPL